MLLRELMVALQGDETAVGLGLGAWLAGIAAGAWAARYLSRNRPELWATLGLALLAIAGPCEAAASRLGRWVLAPPPGELLSIGSSVALALIALAPAGGLVGLTFTALATSASRAGWTAGQGIARLYVLEALGSLAAGILVTFVMVPLFASMTGLLLASSLWLLVALPAAAGGLVPGRTVLPVLALALAVLALPPLSGPIDRATIETRFAGQAPGIPLLAWSETPYQHLALGGNGLRHLYTGGQYAGSFPDPAEHEALAHKLACLGPHTGTLLVVGGGAHGILRHLLAHPFKRIDLVEIDRRALEFVQRFIPSEDLEALRDPRIRIVRDDPRRFLARGEESYDLILILEPPPVTLLLARLSTVQFYSLCAARLAEEGVLAVRLDTAPNVLTGETAALGGALYGALREVFPVVRAGPGPDGLLLAGKQAAVVTLDPAVLARRFEERHIRSNVFVPQLFPILFPPERVAAQEAALQLAASRSPPSRDERPVSFLHALALRQQTAGSRLAPIFGAAARSSPWLLAAVVLIPSLVVLARLLSVRQARRALNLAALHGVAVTGACGMAGSLLILFSYQTRAGALYGQLGWLTALFMLGLALGGLAMSRAAEMPAPAACRRLASIIAAALFFFLLLSGAMAWSAMPNLVHGALLLMAGTVTGGLFPVAAGVLLAGYRDARETASGLEAADHGGAAVAALVGGALFIPALGLVATALLLVGLEAAALVGVGLAALRAARED
jgi:spermidine synthase